jgi:hypothetical protein
MLQDPDAGSANCFLAAVLTMKKIDTDASPEACDGRESVAPVLPPG